jgi:hypothetical protein
MTEQVFDRPCIDCGRVVAFPRPGLDTTCPNCGLYLSTGGQVGRYPSDGWSPGGIQGRRRDRA